MVNFYHDLEIIIKHRSTVILSTQWLIDLFGQLITIPDFTKMVERSVDPKYVHIRWLYLLVTGAEIMRSTKSHP